MHFTEILRYPSLSENWVYQLSPFLHRKILFVQSSSRSKSFDLRLLQYLQGSRVPFIFKRQKKRNKFQRQISAKLKTWISRVKFNQNDREWRFYLSTCIYRINRHDYDTHYQKNETRHRTWNPKQFVSTVTKEGYPFRCVLCMKIVTLWTSSSRDNLFANSQSSDRRWSSRLVAACGNSFRDFTINQRSNN